MKASEIETIQRTAALLMLAGAASESALDEAALAISTQLTNWLAQRLKADAQKATIRTAAKASATKPDGVNPAAPFRKSA
jgi:hypothetical protein